MAYGSKTITTAATLIVGANAKRQVLMIVNHSSKICFIGPDASITTATGIPLYEYSSKENTKAIGYYLGDVYAIASDVGNSDVRYWEVNTR